jgi:hypothetical protein
MLALIAQLSSAYASSFQASFVILPSRTVAHARGTALTSISPSSFVVGAADAAVIVVEDPMRRISWKGYWRGHTVRIQFVEPFASYHLEGWYLEPLMTTGF